jgi:hypothetical protein
MVDFEHLKIPARRIDLDQYERARRLPAARLPLPIGAGPGAARARIVSCHDLGQCSGWPRRKHSRNVAEHIQRAV